MCKNVGVKLNLMALRKLKTVNTLNEIISIILEIQLSGYNKDLGRHVYTDLHMYTHMHIHTGIHLHRK